MELQSLADSIRQYGVLQALVVTRKEFEKPDGGIAVEYELIAGERRLRASKIAGLREVPVLIKSGEQTDLMKLELAIIENVQREDLNPVERAKAFKRLADEFGLTHVEIGKKVGKSRAFVTNTIRLLNLPEPLVDALSNSKISEGHARALGMLNDRPAEQDTLFKEIIYKHLSVRDAESISRKIAQDRVKNKKYILDPETKEIEGKLVEALGTRVSIERTDKGGTLSIDFFSNDDLRQILTLLNSNKQKKASEMLERHLERESQPTETRETKPEDDDSDLYSIKNFSL